MKLRRNAKVDLLRDVPLFSGCSQKEIGQICALADEIYQPDGTTLIQEGTKAREFFVLVEGTVVVRRNGRKLCTLGNGDFFGEIALIANTPRSATVRATSRVRLLVITGQSFQRLLSDTPAIQGKVLLALAQRLAPTLL
jgi:CRP/FNR family cyclic AMP-dependent transcriptional regulator